MQVGPVLLFDLDRQLPGSEEVYVLAGISPAKKRLPGIELNRLDLRWKACQDLVAYIAALVICHDRNAFCPSSPYLVIETEPGVILASSLSMTNWNDGGNKAGLMARKNIRCENSDIISAFKQKGRAVRKLMHYSLSGLYIRKYGHRSRPAVKCKRIFFILKMEAQKQTRSMHKGGAIMALLEVPFETAEEVGVLLNVEMPDQNLVGSFVPAEPPALADVGAATAYAIEHPLGSKPLSQMIRKGDKVTIITENQFRATRPT